MKRTTKCDKCKFNGHCDFQKQVPKGLTVKDCDWFIARRCKDCRYNGNCEIQDAPPPGTFTKKEIEDSKACDYFKPKLGLAKLSDKNSEVR